MPKPKIVEPAPQPASGPTPRLPIGADEPATISVEEQIRLRAYELYEERGRQDGFAVEDWLRAEAEILNKVGQLAA